MALLEHSVIWEQMPPSRAFSSNDTEEEALL